MREETGYTSKEIFEIGKVSPNSALMSNETFSYVALNAEKTQEQELDNMEDIEVTKIKLDLIPDLIKKGEIDHSLVISAFYFLDRFEN